ncbi:MAG: T9SS type A sorting domain-containing protein [Flavobacteriales bacterium]|nr:T9SS type A sorting domain-containing protein [Flavobacteriales bacterium]MCA0390926.1 T9SS type A sorting domain-containing protein [Bacteroidota bacterium]
MRKIHLFVICFLANYAYSQSLNYAKAPNSYIYDLDYAASNNYGGIMIPVKKAYEMWASYNYLKTDGVNTPIPGGIQEASVYWEDIPGLISEVSVVSGETPSDSKIRVEVNSAKGKGNAVIAFKVNGNIYWSWHIWVTDDPSNGVNYSQGFETDVNLVPTQIVYMDRNLGAVSKSFLGNQWQKSGGLMYEWGRKDPFPPLVYKDADFYEISGEVGVLKHRQIDAVNTIPVQLRPFNEIEKNIQYSVKNPLTYIVNTDATGNWFSNSRYKVAAASPNYITWDLWSDNAKGGNSNANSSNAALKNESRSYELKSELDPCPNGWRIPSYYGRETPNNNLSFFGKKDWNNDDSNVNLRQLFPDAVNVNLNGIKVYPGLGMDFTQAQGGVRNLGVLPNPGAYVYYPNSSSPNAPVGAMFQDNNANGGLWSATFGYDGARLFSMISDAYRTNTTVGLHAIYNNQTNPTKTGNAVRCMKDPNLLKIGDFVTEYFKNQKEDYRIGLENPNSYIVVNQDALEIPVNKAFSVYNQLLSDKDMLPSDDLLAKVYWTTNPDLVQEVSIINGKRENRNSLIAVKLAPDQTGNAVISLQNGNDSSPIYWTWHIWKPADDPTVNTVTYTTEAPIPVLYNFVNPTTSKLPPLTTEFMDRNLGAENSAIESGLANGLHYQWGRKDPIPSFAGANTEIYIANRNSSPHADIFTLRKAAGNFTPVNSDEYATLFTKFYEDYGSTQSIRHLKIRDNILYSVHNPMTFLYVRRMGVLYDGGNHYGNDLTKIRDWVSDERAQAENRWGHADKKSPFDPCPEGWRVPDVSFTNLYTGSKGNSPWYNGYKNDAYGKPGVIQDQWHDITTFYGGVVDGNNGWKFENATFKIGNFPKDGIRGELGGEKLTYDRSGVWAASMADLHTGFALAMQFQGNKMQTGTGAYPQAAMSVRCAKDESRLLGVARPKATTNKIQSPVIEHGEIKETLKVYPNPFKDELNVSDDNASSFEIYDLSGKLVMKGNLSNRKLNTTSLAKGVYLCKFVMKNGTSISRKIIKN